MLNVTHSAFNFWWHTHITLKFKGWIYNWTAQNIMLDLLLLCCNEFLWCFRQTQYILVPFFPFQQGSFKKCFQSRNSISDDPCLILQLFSGGTQNGSSLLTWLWVMQDTLFPLRLKKLSLSFNHPRWHLKTCLILIHRGCITLMEMKHK